MAQTAANAQISIENVGTATLVVPQISDTERIFADDDLLPAGDGFSSQDHISEISDN